MKRYHIIGNIQNESFKSIIEPTNQEYHEWVVNNFNSNDELHGLLISLPSNRENAIEKINLALHIRLSPREIDKKAFIPIIFIIGSLKSRQKLLNQLSPFSNLLLTKGIYLYNNIDEAIKEIENLEGLEYSNKEYQKFLNSVYVDKANFVGNHSIANQWGAYRMAEAAGYKNTELASSVSESLGTLYFKYLRAFSYEVKRKSKQKYVLQGIKKVGSINKKLKIELGSKRVLLIDDEAHKGWKEVLSDMFEREQKDQFQVISETVSDYSDFGKLSKEMIESGDFDLFLVDLRLQGDLEENLNTSKLSGAKIARKIKSLNKGNQVVVFTASNKAWNMKSLMEMQEDGYNVGVDGYYIKESPLNGFSKKESEKNLQDFNETIQDCIAASYMREIYKIHSDLVRNCVFLKSESKQNSLKDFYSRTINHLKIAFSLLLNSKNEPVNMNFTFLMYYQILEDFATNVEDIYKSFGKNEYVYTKDGESVCVISGNSEGSCNNERLWNLKYVGRKEDFSYFKIGESFEERYPTTLAKISFVLAFRYACDDKKLEDFGYLNDLRNKVAHADDVIVDDHVDPDEIKDIMEFIKICLTK